MTEDFAEDPRDVERGRLALATLESPPPDPRFRAALKRSFASGAIDVAPDTAPAIEERRVPPRAPRPSWWRPPVLNWAAPAFAMGALAAALVIADRGPGWELMSSSGLGLAIVDGRPIPMNHADDLKLRLRPGARIQVPEDGMLEIRIPGQLGLHLEPGADVVVPQAPGRWFARSVTGEIHAGVLRITSLDRFRGARLTILSPEARVEVTGTTLSVIREPQGTYVCVLEGVVHVGALDGAMSAVPKGQRRFVFNDGRAPESAEMRKDEVAPLGEFHERCAAPIR